MKNFIYTLVCSFSLLGLTTQALAKAEFDFEEDHSLPIVYLNLVVNVGTLNDPVNRLGLANFGAQMMLRGTEKRGKNDFFKALEQLGGVIEPEVKPEGTVFQTAVLSENLDKFLDLLTEAFTQPQITLFELRKLQKEIEGEILSEKGNDRRMVSYHFARFFYGTHPYGNPILGTQNTVSAITFKDMVEYFQNNYGKDTISVFGTGDASQSKINSWYKHLTEKLAKIHPNAKEPQSIAEANVPSGHRVLLVDKPGATQSQVLIGETGMRPENDGFYEVQLANQSFGGGSFQARMMQEIREKRGWSYGAYSTFKLGKTKRHFAMYLMPKTDDTVNAIKLTLQLFDDYVEKGITPTEFSFAKEGMYNKAPFSYDTSKKRLENATLEFLTDFPKDYTRNFANKIKDLSFNNVTAALKKNLNQKDLVLVLIGDAKRLKGEIAKITGFENIVTKSHLED